jgi:LytS/YehU family sensor histidine kinase
MDSHKKILQVASSVPLFCFLLDALATCIGWWQGGKASLLVFYIYALLAFVVVVRIVPQKINEAARAKELEEQQRKLQQELKDRRVSVMMSQIRTHFIFNVMTIISGLCNSDPQKADDAIILFARYLRKNISIMERDEPILFSQELQHLEDYIYLEKMRFGEKITVEKKLEVTDFKIPPLTIQPLMENAIKHGLLASGKTGTVILSSKKTDEGIQITIEDDGVGFVPEALEKEDAVGIRNVRYRLENMVGGTLNIESVPGKGTKAKIRLHVEGVEVDN